MNVGIVYGTGTNYNKRKPTSNALIGIAFVIGTFENTVDQEA